MATVSRHNVKVGADTTQYQREMTRAAMATNKLAAEGKKLAAEQKRLAAASDSNAVRTDRLRKKYDSSYASLQLYKREIQKVSALQVTDNFTLEQKNALLAQVATRYNQTAAAANTMGTAIKTSRFHTANMAAQFNDIGVMMASGQNPFIMAIQQGTQLSQVANSIGGNWKETMAALWGGLKQMAGWQSLIIIGGIAAIGVIVKLGRSFFGAGEAAKDFEEILSDINDLTGQAEELVDKLQMSQRDLAIAYGESAEKARDWFKWQSMALLATAEGKMSFFINDLQLMSEEYITLARASKTYIDNVSRMKNGASIFDEIAAALGTGVDNAQLIAQALWEVQRAANQEDAQEAIENMDELLASMGLTMENLPENVKTAVGEFAEMSSEVARLREQLRLLRAETGDQNTGTPLTANDIVLAPTEDDEGKGKGRSKEDEDIADLERLQEKLMTELELEEAHYMTSQELLERALEKGYLTKEKYAELEEDLKKQHNDRLAQLDVWAHGSTLQQTEAFFGQMAGAFATGNERMMKISQAFGAVEALINAWRTYSQVMADPSLPWFAKIPAAVALFGTAIKAVDAIKGASAGGGGQKTAGGGGTANAGSIQGGAETMPSQQKNLTLIGDRFNRQQAIEIAEFMNEGTDDGLVVRGRR